jgi:hypothetical protein
MSPRQGEGFSPTLPIKLTTKKFPPLCLLLLSAPPRSRWGAKPSAIFYQFFSVHSTPPRLCPCAKQYKKNPWAGPTAWTLSRCEAGAKKSREKAKKRKNSHFFLFKEFTEFESNYVTYEKSVPAFIKNMRHFFLHFFITFFFALLHGRAKKKVIKKCKKKMENTFLPIPFEKKESVKRKFYNEEPKPT